MVSASHSEENNDSVLTASTNTHSSSDGKYTDSSPGGCVDSSEGKYTYNMNSNSRPPLPPKKRHCLQHIADVGERYFIITQITEHMNLSVYLFLFVCDNVVISIRLFRFI